MFKKAFQIRNVKTGVVHRVDSESHGERILSELRAIYGFCDYVLELARTA